MEPYPYEMDDNHELKLNLVIDKLRQIDEPNKSVLILHTSAHNPTGVDPTKAQWREIKKVCYERGILPVFDCAYQVIKLVLQYELTLSMLHFHKNYSMN